MYKEVGTVSTGVRDLVSVLHEISKDKVGLALASNGVYYIEDIKDYNKLDYVVAADLGIVEDKFVESVYDNQDLEDYKQYDLVNKVPKGRIPFSEYLSNEVVQKLYDYAISLNPGMYYLKYDDRTKELYLIVAENW